MERNFKNYTRVSDVLYPFSGLQDLDPEVVNNAAERGTAVHKICESIIAGLGEFGVEDHLAGYVESFKKWWTPCEYIMERRFWDSDQLITGQCDLIIDGTLIDLKTSYRPGKTWPVQGNAYAYMARHYGDIPVKKIQFIHLQKTGKPPKIYEYPIDPDLWLSVLRTYKHFYEKPKRERNNNSDK